MMNTSEALAITETYLKEMLEADDNENFELYVKRYEAKRLEGFTRDKFSNDIKHMHERNGMNTGYEFLGRLRNPTLDGAAVFRSVWKGIYEKRDAVIEMGVYKKNDVWYILHSIVH